MADIGVLLNSVFPDDGSTGVLDERYASSHERPRPSFFGLQQLSATAPHSTPPSRRVPRQRRPPRPTPPMATKRIASQVHKQASRLIREGYFKREPAWYRAVLDHPPLPLPAREPAPRTRFDAPGAAPLTRPADAKKIKPLEVRYLEDKVRRQFFRDHPFEAFRQTTLVEGAAVQDEHPVRGAEWTRLRQRGRNPSPEECVHVPLLVSRRADPPLPAPSATP